MHMARRAVIHCWLFTAAKDPKSCATRETVLGLGVLFLEVEFNLQKEAPVIFMISSRGLSGRCLAALESAAILHPLRSGVV